MKNQVTVDKAISRGLLTVNGPVLLTLIGCPILALIFSKNNVIPDWGIGIAVLIGTILAWLIWSFRITKWRIWAFENVRNVHELRQKAIEFKLIWPEGSIFEKTEIRSNEVKEKLKTIKKKFELEDVYEEDYTLPPKKEIYYSIIFTFMELRITFLIIGMGIFFIILKEQIFYFLGASLAIIGVYVTMKEFRNPSNKEVQIIIDANGIQTKNSELKSWSNIKSEVVIQEGTGSSIKHYLTFYYNETSYEKINIDYLNVTPNQMENILRTYRIRHEKKTNNILS
jgi:hypothetical protein